MYQVDQHYEQLKATFPNQQIVIAETGWPSAGPTIGAAVASPENAANYLQAFVSWAEAKGVDYFYFSSADEPWKRGVEGEQGAHWGIAFTDQKIKPGVQRTLDGERSADSWSMVPTNPPITTFFGLPNRIETNLPTFFLAGPANPTDVVKVNGTLVPVNSGM